MRHQHFWSFRTCLQEHHPRVWADLQHYWGIWPERPLTWSLRWSGGKVSNGHRMLSLAVHKVCVRGWPGWRVADVTFSSNMKGMSVICYCKCKYLSKHVHQLQHVRTYNTIETQMFWASTICMAESPIFLWRTTSEGNDGSYSVLNWCC